MDKTVFVTGGSRGIGKAIALAFGAAGYNVLINCYENTDLANGVVNEIKKQGGSAAALRCDVSDYVSLEKNLSLISPIFDGVDVLVNNAGITYNGLFNLMEPEAWRRLIDVNICGVLNTTKLVLPAMLTKRSGVIINISSIWGETGASCETVYSMTKGAVNTFTKALAKETAPNGVRVNAIACGVIDTTMNSHLSTEEYETLIDRIPMNRAGTPGDVAKLALFLASDDAAYLTGQVITLDGGFI